MTLLEKTYCGKGKCTSCILKNGDYVSSSMLTGSEVLFKKQDKKD